MECEWCVRGTSMASGRVSQGETGAADGGRRMSASDGVTRFAGRRRIVRGSHTISCEYPAPVTFPFLLFW